MDKSRSVLLVSIFAAAAVCLPESRPVRAAGIGLAFDITIKSGGVPANGIANNSTYDFDYFLDNDQAATIATTSVFRWIGTSVDNSPILSFTGIFKTGSGSSFITPGTPLNTSVLFEPLANDQTKLTFSIGPAPTGWTTGTGTLIDTIITSVVLNQAFIGKGTGSGQLNCTSCTIQEVFTAYNLIDGAFDIVTTPPAQADNLINLVAESGSSVSFDVTQARGVPGPMPLLGAATAFGFSRRLRRRIKLQADR